MTNSSTSTQPEIINGLRLGVPLGYALLAGMQLDVFTALKDGPRTADQLAASLAADAARLRALLYALVVAGLFAIFEAVRGWCFLRACGIRTKL